MNEQISSLVLIWKKLNLTNPIQTILKINKPKAQEPLFCSQKIHRYIHEHFFCSFSLPNPYLGNDAFSSLSLGWREETVEVEREGVKLFISAISFKCSELSPPWHSPIFRTVLVVKSVVQKHSNNQCHRWRRKEYSIKEIIELQKPKNNNLLLTCMFKNILK